MILYVTFGFWGMFRSQEICAHMRGFDMSAKLMLIFDEERKVREHNFLVLQESKRLCKNFECFNVR